jgi:hypothetical protein
MATAAKAFRDWLLTQELFFVVVIGLWAIVIIEGVLGLFFARRCLACIG